MGIGDIVAQLAADHPQAALIVALFAVGLLELATGIVRALANGTFKLDLVDVWVRVQLAGRILPIVLVLIVGSVFPPITVGGFTFDPILIAANTGAAVFLIAAGKSIMDNINPGAPDVLPKE